MFQFSNGEDRLLSGSRRVDLAALLCKLQHCDMAALEPRVGVPKLFARCFETLRGALRTECLFQVESPIAEVHSLYGIFQASGEVPADVYTPHAVCGLVFLLLERLALPLRA